MMLVPATKPTFYFIGVTTQHSAIMRVFPKWAAWLGLGDVAIKGIDLASNSSADAYRSVVSLLKSDPLSLGALVTTHKLSLFEACFDQFDEVDPYARLMRETSCLSKRNGALICHAKDPISSGLAIECFLPEKHFKKTHSDIFVIGAGGSSIAITWHAMRKMGQRGSPKRIIVSDRSKARLEHIERIHLQIGTSVPCEYALISEMRTNDHILEGVPNGSLVINATGLGKDAPGSPLGENALFPRHAIVWELNYRGDLIFLEQAKRQAVARDLQLEDGWTYFLHGWTQVIAEVFDIEIPTSGPQFEEISRIAASAMGRTT
ncbi:MAG: shikimate dehydrogenase [Pseudomonadota bacterium]